MTIKRINIQTGEIEILDEDAPSFESSVEEIRATTKCSRMQGILALGETGWNTVIAYRDAVDENGQFITPWQQRIIIDDAGDWYRTSQNIQFFGYLLGMNDVEIDTMFKTAINIIV